MKTTALLLFMFTVCRADTIQLNSGVTTPGASNNITGANVAIAAHPWWAVSSEAQWISYADTGWGGSVVPNATGESPTASFYQDFYFTGEGNNRAVGDIMVWADDTASVFLDGVPLIFRSLELGDGCTKTGIGCLEAHGVNLHFDIFGDPGSKHTLRFDVFQQWSDTFGLMYNGTVEFTDPPSEGPITPNPEPASLGILGGFLLAVTTFGRVRYERRRDAAAASTSK